MIRPTAKILLNTANWWIIVPLVLFSSLSLLVGDFSFREHLTGWLGLFMLYLVFKAVRIFRILRKLPPHVNDTDVVRFFRADAAHPYFSIKDVVSGIQEEHNKNKANKAEMATPRKPSD